MTKYNVLQKISVLSDNSVLFWIPCVCRNNCRLTTHQSWGPRPGTAWRSWGTRSWCRAASGWWAGGATSWRGSARGRTWWPGSSAGGWCSDYCSVLLSQCAALCLASPGSGPPLPQDDLTKLKPNLSSGSQMGRWAGGGDIATHGVTVTLGTGHRSPLPLPTRPKKVPLLPFHGRTSIRNSKYLLIYIRDLTKWYDTTFAMFCK